MNSVFLYEEAAPFVKWAGGKSQILEEIRTKYPKELGKSITKYAEPFVGGGAVLFDILNKYDLSEIYISDINRELIHTYTCVRDNVDNLIKLLLKTEKEYLLSDNKIREDIYYNKRKQFNLLKEKKSEDLELAALFIFLNRTCFNGLYRVNSHGAFNVPIGSYNNPKICDEDRLIAVSEKLKRINIICGDYKLSRNFIDEKTFAYFDPPYRPLSQTSSFNAYDQNSFDDAAQKELAKFIGEIDDKGAYMAISNSDPKNTDQNDNFFDKLYEKYKINRINVARMINSAGNKRGKISELLIANY